MKKYLPGDLIKIDSASCYLYRNFNDKLGPWGIVEEFYADESSFSMVISSLKGLTTWANTYFVSTIYGLVFLLKVHDLKDKISTIV